MSRAEQDKAVRSRLEILEDFKVQLEDLLGSTCNVIQLGESWLEKRDSKTFVDIYQFLTNQIEDCIRKCFSIASNKQPSQLLLKRIKKLNTKFKEHKRSTNDKISTEIQKIEKKNSKKFDEIINEFQAASILMTDLQNETKSLSQQINERTTAVNCKEQTGSNTVVNLDEMKLEISSTTGSLTNLKSLYDELSCKLNENDKKIAELCFSVRNSVADRKETENNYQRQVEDIENKIKSITEAILEIQSESKSTSLQIEELQKLNERTKFIAPLKKKMLDLSTFVTEFKISLERSVCEQVKTIEENNDKFKRLSKAVIFRSQPFIFYVALDTDWMVDLRETRNVLCFNQELYNEGNHFDLKTGIFSAPCNGFYLISLIIDINDQRKTKFNVYVKSKHGEEVIERIEHFESGDTLASFVFNKVLRQDDEMYIRPHKSYYLQEVSRGSHFACALIKNF